VSTPAPPPPPAAKPAPVSTWQPVPVPPRHSITPSRPVFAAPPILASFDTPDGLALVDDTGNRWLFAAPGAEPAPPAPLPGGPAAAMYLDAKRGFAVLTHDHRLLGAKSFLGELVPLLPEPLPAAVEAKKLRWFHEGLTAVVDGTGEAFALRAGQLQPLVAPPTLRFADVLLGSDGAGVALFLPEQVGITTDFGATWKLLALPGVQATSLRPQGEAEGGLALVLPGGLRDGFPRSVDPHTGAVERAIAGTDPTETVVPSQPGGPARRPRASRGGRGSLSLEAELLPPFPPSFPPLPIPGASAQPLPAPRPLRFAAPTTPLGHADSVSLDGDEVLFFALAAKSASSPERNLVAHRGKLGEGVLPSGPAVPSCVVKATALCGAKSALLCVGTLHLFENDAPVGQVSVPDATHLTFAPDGALLVASSERGPQLAPTQPSRTTLRRILFPPTGTVPAATPATPPDPLELAELDAGAPSFDGGCHSPAIWVRSGGTAARYLPAAQGFDHPRQVDALHITHGVNHEGALVVSKDDSLELITNDETPIRSLSLGEPIRSGHLTFAADGRHGLWVARSGQVSQTDDGGQTFRPIDTPAVGQSLPALCGATRCQLGSGMFREGFDRDPAREIAAWPAPPTPSAAKRFSPPVVLTCQGDHRFAFAEHNALTLTPRIGTGEKAGGAPTFFAGAALDEKNQGSLLWGDTSGKLTTEKLRLPPTPKDDPERELSARGTGAFVMRRWQNGDDRVRTTFRWDATDSTTTLTTSDISPVAEHALLRTDGAGLGFLDFRKSDAILWGKAPLERRSLDLLEAGWGGGSGFVHVEPDGTWVLLQMLTDAENGSIRLDVVPSPNAGGKARTASRTLVVSSHAHAASDARARSDQGLLPLPLEFGAGVDSTGEGDRRVALWERTEEGGDELRIRSLGPDLSLGAATAVPHTRTKPGDLLVLPSCPATPTGMLVWLETRASIRAVAGEERVDGPLVRLLRVTPTSACVERTFVAAAPGDLSSTLVLAGNGEHGAQSELGSVTCQPVTARVPSGEELTAPKRLGGRPPPKK
jgi:hypothetical protein